MNPVELAHSIEERYRSYLSAMFYFRDPGLRESFQAALASGHLSRGPYLEATPTFRRARPLRQLIPALPGFQDARPDEGFLHALQGDRALYQHQEQAITRSCEGANVVVATGTASGKTEAFVYPILLHLYHEFLSGDLCPGVRALILYPMNALAHDQRERLGEICSSLRQHRSPFRFTFGQYVGETPENKDDTRRRARDLMREQERKGFREVEDGEVVAGELVLRSEMRQAPPHILLTNYSMLEYLLLRPADSELFDNGRSRWWTFVVLDEAHQYRGSRGTEMAMLLRRLKERLREGGRSRPFRCIATSATLAGGAEDTDGVAVFASNLFGESFAPEDVILVDTEPIPEPAGNCLPAHAYPDLREALDPDSPGGRDLVDAMLIELGVVAPPTDNTTRRVSRALASDARAGQLRHRLSEGSALAQDLASELFSELPEDERMDALSGLVELLARVEGPGTAMPLLMPRYHLFLKSLEGAFVSFTQPRRVLLDRQAQIGEAAAFEVALCRECGEHYLVGRRVNGRLAEAIRDPADPDFGAEFYRPVETVPSSEDQSSRRLWHLCTQCAAMWVAEGPPLCQHNAAIMVEEQELASDREDQVPKCTACGYRGPDPVREVVHGTDGPHAVIATALHNRLPPGRKKVLAFADARQDAAFFAWYLHQSYRDVLARNLILEAMQTGGPDQTEGSSPTDLVTTLGPLLRENELLSAAASEAEVRREAWRLVYRELLTDEPRISLEGVGLVAWSVKWPDWIRSSAVIAPLTKPPWSLPADEAWGLTLLLIDVMRAAAAVELQLPKSAGLSWPDLCLQRRQNCFRIGSPKGRSNVVAWDGPRARPAQLLAKILARRGCSQQEAVELAVRVLRVLWQALGDCEATQPDESRLLVPVGDCRRLSASWYRASALRDESTLFICDVCGRLQTVAAGGVCTRYHCPGTLSPTRQRDLEPNHYRNLYQAGMRGPFRVEEHTAQLDYERAREYQRDFKEGRIQVLSCSTTFELGVDLGDLDVIFLRNVPPEAFNYAQRVGRAGRRQASPGFAVTYCRRGPHDLYHFSAPDRMLAGEVRPPTLALANDRIIGRHLAATALSEFFRAEPSRFRSVQALFQDLVNPVGVPDFRRFLHEHRTELGRRFRAIAPLETHRVLGLDDDGWIERISGPDSGLARAEAEVASDFQAVRALETTSAEQRDYRTARWAKDRGDTIEQEDVLSFLSRKGVIPKYGFPVDVVELDTHRTQSRDGGTVSLQRDLAIAVAEFAPTSRVVADKREWVSYGLKRVAGREWPRGYYKYCRTHNQFVRWGEGEPEGDVECGCAVPRFQYVIPTFGFVSEHSPARPPLRRPERLFTTRPFFVRREGPGRGSLTCPSDASGPLVTVSRASPGLMMVVCEGKRREGFYICQRCGAGFRGREDSHKDFMGQECSGSLVRVSLAHEFVTDVIEIFFDPAPTSQGETVWFGYSLAFALLEAGAEVLEVPSGDLNVTTAHAAAGTVPPIILYDNVPGGAGLVARLEDERLLRECLGAALERVSGRCGCSDMTSCYGCLRSYRNQFAHQYLQRGPVRDYLSKLLEAWP